MKVLAILLVVCVASTYGQTIAGIDVSNLLGSLSGVGPALDTAVHGLLNNLITQLQTTLAGGISFGKRSIVLNHLQNLQGLLSGSADNILSQVQSILAQFESQVGQFLGNLGSLTGKRALLTAAAQAKGEITDAFNGLLNEALGHLTSIATNLANVGLASLLGALTQGKRGILDTLGLTDAFNNITSTLGTHINNITGSLTQLGSDLLGAVTPHIDNLTNELINHGLNAAQSLTNTLAGISSTLTGK